MIETLVRSGRNISQLWKWANDRGSSITSYCPLKNGCHCAITFSRRERTLTYHANLPELIPQIDKEYLMELKKMIALGGYTLAE